MAADLVPQPNTHLASRQGFILPGAIARAGRAAQEGFLEFFFASIRNVNTREAYARAVRDFFAWCEERGAELDQISPLLIAAYIEKHPGSAPTVKQHLAALRMLFDYLVVKQIIPTNPAAAVKGPKHVAREGKTPVLSTAQVRDLFGAIDISKISGLRDRALIGVMLYTFGRISAVVGMRVSDYSPVGKRSMIRLREKGGKTIDLPAHHNLVEWLDEYVEAAGIKEERRKPLFRSLNARRELTDRALHRTEALVMVKRRAKRAGIPPDTICNHSMRGTGITTYLEGGGQLEYAQWMAAHADVRTTKLYDRRQQRITQDEVERISYW